MIFNFNSQNLKVLNYTQATKIHSLKTNYPNLLTRSSKLSIKTYKNTIILKSSLTTASNNLQLVSFNDRKKVFIDFTPAAITKFKVIIIK